MAEIYWPRQYRPTATSVHVSNDLEMQAPPERVWAWLVRAVLWPTWYENANNVRIEGSLQADLQLGTRFHWNTFGLGIESVVEEFEPYSRIGWTGIGTGMDVYHAWVIEPRPVGCYVLTQENQNGLAARMQSVLLPDRMHKHHQIWLESLNRQAQQGPPPVA